MTSDLVPVVDTINQQIDNVPQKEIIVSDLLLAVILFITSSLLFMAFIKPYEISNWLQRERFINYSYYYITKRFRIMI